MSAGTETQRVGVLNPRLLGRMDSRSPPFAFCSLVLCGWVFVLVVHARTTLALLSAPSSPCRNLPAPHAGTIAQGHRRHTVSLLLYAYVSLVESQRTQYKCRWIRSLVAELARSSKTECTTATTTTASA